MGFLKTFFRRGDPMKLKIFTFIKIIFNIYFLGKKKIFLFINIIYYKISFWKNKTVPLGITALYSCRQGESPSFQTSSLAAFSLQVQISKVLADLLDMIIHAHLGLMDRFAWTKEALVLLVLNLRNLLIRSLPWCPLTIEI